MEDKGAVDFFGKAAGVGIEGNTGVSEVTLDGAFTSMEGERGSDMDRFKGH